MDQTHEEGAVVGHERGAVAVGGEGDGSPACFLMTQPSDQWGKGRRPTSWERQLSHDKGGS